VAIVDSPTVTFRIPGIYQVKAEVTDTNGCHNQFTALIEILSNDVMTIPTAFSPNGDGKNDLLTAQSHLVSSLHFEVFDRWGKSVFETESLAINWDGLLTNGAPAMEGTYLFLAQVISNRGEKYTKKGTITVIR